MTRGAEGLCLRLFAAAFVLFAGAMAALGGPHHFQKWADGEVVSVDTRRHVLAIRMGGAGTETTLTWDNQTKLVSEPNDSHDSHESHESRAPASHPGVTEADHLRAGEHVRVLYQNQGKDLLARRIVRGPAPEHVVRK